MAEGEDEGEDEGAAHRGHGPPKPRTTAPASSTMASGIRLLALFERLCRSGKEAIELRLQVLAAIEATPGDEREPVTG